MRIVRLAYGKHGLDLQLDERWDVTVIEPRNQLGLPNPQRALQASLRSPIGSAALKDRVKSNMRVGIVFSDLTRPTPNSLMLPVILAELEHVPRQNITLFNGLGAHRPNTQSELRDMLGDKLVDSYRIVQNDAFDSSTQVYLGVSSFGNEIWLNRELLECDFKIYTGFIEPHIFAGFSGGGKAVMPGMAGQITIYKNHAVNNIFHPKATWGVAQGNPVFEEIQEIALKTGESFLLNVCLNKDKQISGIFAGDLKKAHLAGCAFASQAALISIPHPYDIVVTTNSGYPLDLNLYQSVKGMSVAAQAVREGGAIILAAECWDGIPDEGLYGQLLQSAANPAELLEHLHQPEFQKRDVWQAALQAQIQLKADVYVHSHFLTDSQIRSALLLPSHRIEDTIQTLLERYSSQAKICILPEGPQTVPFVQ